MGRPHRAGWPKDELRKTAEADDLQVSPFREDGATLGTPTWIWSVAVDDALYVRPYNGWNSDLRAKTSGGRRETAGSPSDWAIAVSRVSFG
jgi:hypothetical protein